MGAFTNLIRCEVCGRTQGAWKNRWHASYVLVQVCKPSSASIDFLISREIPKTKSNEKTTKTPLYSCWKSTPLKINMEHNPGGKFGSDHFPFFSWVMAVGSSH